MKHTKTKHFENIETMGIENSLIIGVNTNSGIHF